MVALFSQWCHWCESHGVAYASLINEYSINYAARTQEQRHLGIKQLPGWQHLYLPRARWLGVH